MWTVETQTERTGRKQKTRGLAEGNRREIVRHSRISGEELNQDKVLFFLFIIKENSNILSTLLKST